MTVARVESNFPAVVRAGALGRWTVRIAATERLGAGTLLALARRWPSDWGVPQAGDPAAPDYLAVAAADGAPLAWRTERRPDWHPFDHVLFVELVDALAPGAAIEIRYGDAAGGSPGARAQTFVEEASPLSVRVRPAGAGDWTELALLTTRVIGTTPHRLEVIAPSRVAVGERFAVRLRVEDAWGNPACDVNHAVEIAGARAVVTSEAGSVATLHATLDAAGVHVLRATGALAGASNPILCEASPATRVFWGDIHAQSVIGCGARTVERYFHHARDFAGVDFASHQANCFLVSTPEWRETEEVTRRYNEDGRFVTLLGVEWSAQRALGGDHNLYFPGDRAELRRCSHQFVADKSDLATDLAHVTDVYAHYRGTDTLIAVHVGGRTADLQWHEPTLDRLLEVHSTHATSEWFLFEALRRGHRFGVIAGSDGVDGRPGASHPGHMNVRNVRGGLVAVEMRELSRAALWAALKARRCWATTGERILLAFSADGRALGEEYATAAPPRMTLRVEGTAPLAAVEIFRGTEIVFAAPIVPVDPAPSDEIRIAWRGLAQQGNWERARMAWHGHLAVTGGRILDARGWALDTPDEGIVERTGSTLRWRSITGGDWDGVVVRLAETPATELAIVTDPLSARVRATRLAEGPVEIAAEDPERRLRIDRLPRAPAPTGWSGDFVDQAAPAGRHAYWVRVRQEDGACAWSSPIFAEVAR